MKQTVVDTPDFHFEIKDGIFFLTYKGKISLEIAKRVVKKRLEISEGIVYPLFIKGVKVSVFDKDARDYLASEDGRKGVKAGAIFVDSVFNYFLGNFFLKVTVNKPKIPTQIFNDKEKALKWLEQYK